MPIYNKVLKMGGASSLWYTKEKRKVLLMTFEDNVLNRRLIFK